MHECEWKRQENVFRIWSHTTGLVGVHRLVLLTFFWESFHTDLHTYTYAHTYIQSWLVKFIIRDVYPKEILCLKVCCIRGFIYNQESKKTNLRIPNFTNYGSHITYRFTLRTSKPNIWFYQETDFFHYMAALIFKFLLQVFEKCQKTPSAN